MTNLLLLGVPSVNMRPNVIDSIIDSKSIQIPKKLKLSSGTDLLQ